MLHRHRPACCVAIALHAASPSPCTPHRRRPVPLVVVALRAALLTCSLDQVISSKMRKEVAQLPARWAVPLLVLSNDDFRCVIVIIIIISTSAATCIIPHNSI